MRIALTHNLQTSDAESEAEFDTPETIAALVSMLEKLGHTVDLVEVSGPVARTIDHLELTGPDLVFNTAEGHQGRFREGFYPALFEQIGLPYTGSDAHVCDLTLDKQLTKLVVAARGVATPGWLFVDRPDASLDHALRYPLIVKPNYEGSSKGIHGDSIITSPELLHDRVATALSRYPEGVLVEEFIAGHDVTVPFIENVSPDTGGILPPAEYHVRRTASGSRDQGLYDFELKSRLSHLVEVRVPAALTPTQLESIQVQSRTVIQALGIRDVARMDFRVDEFGTLYFLEVNALPSFEPGASLYASAAAAGLRRPHQVLEAVIHSALARRGLDVNIRPRRSRASRARPRVGLIYNLKRITPTHDGDDSEAEYDAPSTVEAVARAIQGHGCQVVPLEATSQLVDALPRAGVDVAFNIAEGIGGRTREAQVPALLELLQIPYTGSDPAALALTLDKGLAKRVMAQAGIPTAPFVVIRTAPTRLPAELSFPVIVKPVAEGSSKGVVTASVARNVEELRALVTDLVARYRQPALVEQFLPGREFTVGLLGSAARPLILPPMEVVFTDPAVEHPVYSYQHKIDADASIRYEAPAAVSEELRRDLISVARRAFATLGCRDVGRIDLRLDAAGRATFIECNPLPGLTPGWSDLVLIASSAGIDYDDLIGRILAPAMRRAGKRLGPRQAAVAEDARASA